MLLRYGTAPEFVELSLPSGDKAVFHIHSAVINNSAATCSVIKDAGDDPDVTNGAEVVVTTGAMIEGQGSRTQKTGLKVKGQESSGKGQERSPTSSFHNLASVASAAAEVEMLPEPSEEYGDAIYVGMRVRHPKFGPGTIRKIEGSGDGQKVIVWFNSGGPKKLLVRFAGLERV